jgi:hypothetical protein
LLAGLAYDFCVQREFRTDIITYLTMRKIIKVENATVRLRNILLSFAIQQDIFAFFGSDTSIYSKTGALFIVLFVEENNDVELNVFCLILNNGGTTAACL